MIPIQTRVYDTLNKKWLDGDHVLNLFTHPELHTSEGLSVYLACPSRYKVCRWTGEKDINGNKIFIGDVLTVQDKEDYSAMCFVDENGAAVVVKAREDNCVLALLSDWASDNQTEIRLALVGSHTFEEL